MKLIQPLVEVQGIKGVWGKKGEKSTRFAKHNLWEEKVISNWQKQ
jgi:hypothetical protein